MIWPSRYLYLSKRLLETISRFQPLAPLVRSIISKTLFRDEMRLLKGRHPSGSSSPSILFFTTQRCASRFIGHLLRRLAKNADLKYVDIEGLYFTIGPWTDAPDGIYEFEGLITQDVFNPSGYMYGPIRAYVPGIAELHSYKTILMLRDPRDVLTSWYSSIAHRHLIPYYNPPAAEALLAVRSRALEHGVDEFVLREANHWRSIYATYCRELLNQPFALHTSFEHMTNDFESWLYQLTDFLNLDVPRDIAKQLIGSAAARKVIPGRYRSELRTETIQELNHQFSDILELLGYC